MSLRAECDPSAKSAMPLRAGVRLARNPVSKGSLERDRMILMLAGAVILYWEQRMQVDIPDVVAEVRAAFDRYEQALVTNDVTTLDEMFRNDPRTIRYGQSENLYGYEEI